MTERWSLEFISERLRILYRGTYVRAGAFHFRSRYSFSRRCNSINSFVRRYRKSASRRTMYTAAARFCIACALHLAWQRAEMRNCSGRYISEPMPTYKSMLSEKSTGKEDDKKRIELSATVKRYISDAIVIGDRRAAFSIPRVSRLHADVRENWRVGDRKLYVSNYAIRY